MITIITDNHTKIKSFNKKTKKIFNLKVFYYCYLLSTWNCRFYQSCKIACISQVPVLFFRIQTCQKTYNQTVINSVPFNKSHAINSNKLIKNSSFYIFGNKILYTVLKFKGASRFVKKKSVVKKLTIFYLKAKITIIKSYPWNLL